MAITKPPVIPAWAESGDKVTPSNAEIQVGWPLSSIPPSRQRFNWLLNFLANGIRYFSRRGLPDYDATETYMIGDRIIGDDGKTYRSLIDNNTGQTPSAQPTKWEEWAPSLSRLADLLQKQTYTAFTTAGAAPNFTLTPAPAITAYTSGQRFRVKFHAAGSGADVLNVSGLGNKGLKQYDTAGAKVAAVIAANMLVDVEYDGVDFVLLDRLPPTTGPTPAQFDNSTKLATTAFIQANGLRYGFSSVSANRNLALSDIGNICWFSGGYTVTMPTPTSLGVPVGATVTFYNTFPGTATVTAGSGASFDCVASPVSIKQGEFIIFVATSTTQWTQFGIADLGKVGSFSSSLVSPGYQKLPSGLIIQWGTSGSVAASSVVNVTLPIAFPNDVLSVTGTPVGISINSNSAGVGIAASVSALTIYNWGSAIAYSSGVRWIAIGY